MSATHPNNHQATASSQYNATAVGEVLFPEAVLGREISGSVTATESAKEALTQVFNTLKA
jgi:phage-related minor tail protein